MLTLRSFVLGVLVAGALLSTTTAGAAAVPSEGSGMTAPCATEVDVASLLRADDQPEAPQCEAPTPPVALESAFTLRRTCRCSCGFPCQTSADCGGAACTVGISCC